MKVFVAGATGVLGRRVVALLRDAGYRVVGLARSEANVAQLERMGAEARRGDIFSTESMLRASADCAGILHLATSIPTKNRIRRADWLVNDRLRREGTRNLAMAAVENGAQFYVQEGLLNIYGNRRGAWVHEETALDPPSQPILESTYDMEGILGDFVSRERLPAIVLRFGVFYSREDAHTKAMLAMLSARKLPVPGRGDAFWNMIHVDDAARAVLQAVKLHAGLRGETLNIADGAPVAMGELLRFLASELGAAEPRSIPAWLARLAIGSDVIRYMLSSFRADVGKARRMLLWLPEYPDYKAGFHQVMQAAPAARL